ncbi:MAG: WG repeat-containing protein [Eubacteriales bacterium]|jgi:hypothetical protein
MLRLFLKISSRLISATLLVGVTVGFIYLATTRSLPFLHEDEPVYSIIDHSSKPDSTTEESRNDTSGDHSQTDESTKEETFDIQAYLKTFEKVNPLSSGLAISQYKYDKTTQKVVLYDDISALGNLAGKDIEIRMGFIFADGRLYTSNLADVTDLLSGYTFVGERDIHGNPLFIKGNNYYYLDSSFVIQQSDFSPMQDKRGFGFDVPVYFGVPDSNIKRTYNKSRPDGERYGYYDSVEDRSYASYCVETFAYIGGRGVGIKKKNGVPVLEIYGTRFLENGGNLIASGYYFPSDRGLYSIGYFYFDDGFTRVRIKKSNNTYVEGLIDTSGKLLPLLDDYKLVSYSDSVLLVSNGTYFGYMTNNLNWITNPVFKKAEPFLEGLAVVGVEDDKYGVVDTGGNYVVKPVFDRIVRCSGGIFAAYSETEGWFIFAKVYM